VSEEGFVDGEVFDRFIEAVARADAPGIAATLASNVRMRAMIPQGAREDEGPDDVAARFVDWFGDHTSEVVSASHESFGGRVRVTYRLRLGRDGAAWDLEQHAFCDLDGERIARIDLVCSGFRPVVEHDGNGTYRYDAGTMSCNEGLDGEFKQAIGSIPVGAVLQVRARDAAARVELPSFARLLGHSVGSVEEPEGGGVLVSVERRR
jgi:TusA-related sulfurtransferase